MKIIQINGSCNGELIRKPYKEANGYTHLRSCFLVDGNGFICKIKEKKQLFYPPNNAELFTKIMFDTIGHQF